MADASNAQTSFLGGEWSPYAQGRFDDAEYKRGMNVCLNGHPIEAGAWTRRVGSRHKGFTRHGQKAKIIQFSFSQNLPYDMEFTDGKLRFYDSQGLIMAEEPRLVRYINAGSPARVTTTAACAGLTDWKNGDTVVFNFMANGAPMAAGALLSRQFSITLDPDQTHFLLYDAITGAPVDGATIGWTAATTMLVSRVFEIDTPYDNGAWASLRAIQNDDSVLLLHPTIRPYSIFAPIDGGNMFTFNPTQFIDGPYLDPPIDGSFLTVSGVTGVITVNIVYPTWSSAITYKNGTRFFTATQRRSGAASTSTQYAEGTVVLSGGLYYVSIQDGNINHAPASNPLWWRALAAGEIVGPTGLTSDDIGRAVRLLAQPNAWVAATAYTTDQLVQYQDAYYVALQGSTGKVPGVDLDNWGVASNAIKWTWGIITAVASAVQFSLSIQGDDLLYNQNVTTYRFGAFSDSTAWPSCGTFHEGRFWLGGAIKNRFDAGATFGNAYEMTPTAPDGTVSDANGITYTLLSPQQNQLLWMLPDRQGITMGTAQGEWLLQSSANNDPITPTSIQSHNFTNIGSANIEAIRTGMSIAFVQRYGKKLIDYVGDPFGNFSGTNLSEKAKHLTAEGIVRIAYQHELVPTIWALTGDNKLIGTTYKRESVMPGQAPVFNGWHRHELGSGFEIIDMCASASPDGLLDSITLVTQDPTNGVCRVETMTEMFDETSDISDAWFLDNGQVPSSALVTSVSGVDGVMLTGFAQSEGKTVTAFLGNLDLGDHVVTGGQIFVPFLSDADRLFTLAYVQALSGDDFQYTVRISYNNPSAQQQTIMEFPPIGSPYLDGYSYLNYGAIAIADWTRDRVTFVLTSTSPYAGFIQYRISTGALLKYAQTSEIFNAYNPPYYSAATAYPASPMVTGSDNKIYTAQVANSYGQDPTISGQRDWLSTGLPGVVPAAYSGATAYSNTDFATSGGIIYKSLQNANTGHTPVSSPTFWQAYYAVPAVWSATTTYGTPTFATGSDGHIYWTFAAVPAGQGDPSSFPTANPYWGTLGQVWPNGRIATTGLGLDYNGDFYMYQGGITPYLKIDGTTLRVKGRMTAVVGQTIPAPSNYVVPLRIFTNNFTAEADFILETVDTTPDGTTAPSACLMEVGSLNASENTTFTFDEGNSPVACSGSPAIGIGQAFILTRPVAGQSTALPVGLYEINVFSQNRSVPKRIETSIFKPEDPNKGIYGNYGPTGSTMNKLGTIVPTDIDPTWTFFVGWGGIIYDQRDGNILTSVSTVNPATWNALTVYAVSTGITSGYALGSDNNVYKAKNAGTLADPVTDGGVHWTLIRAKATVFNYIVKLTTNCAKIRWRIAASFPTTADNCPFINIENGHYTFIENLGVGGFQGRKINTVTGDTSTYTVGGISPLGFSQLYNDVTGDILLFPQSDSTQPNAPTRVDPVGGTTSTLFTEWARYRVAPDELVYKVPGVVGFTYTSQGQVLRPVSPAESGARNGPAFGKTRRNHRYAIAVANTQGLSVGSEFTKLRPALFKSRAGKGALLLTAATLYTGEHSDNVEGDYDLDGMLCFQSTRPLPATVTALGGFLQTQDR